MRSLPYEVTRLWQCCSCHIDQILWQAGTWISRSRNLPCRWPPNGTQRLPRRCRPAQLAARPPTFILPDKPQLRISLEMFAVEGDGRLSGSEGISDEAGENMDHGVHRRPVA